METSDQPDPSLAPAAGGRAKVVFLYQWEEQRKQTFRCQAVCGRIVSDCSWCRRPTAFSKTKNPGGDRAAVDSDIWFSLAGCESGPGRSTVLLPAGESPLTAASAPDSAGRVGLRLTVEDVDKSCDAAADRDRRVTPPAPP